MLCGVFCVWIAVAGVVGGCAGRAPSVACLSRVRGHACVCSACWLRGDWDLDRRHTWSLAPPWYVRGCLSMVYRTNSVAVCIHCIQYLLA